MSDGQNGLQVHRCPECAKPTPEKLGYCRHCKASFTGKGSIDWWSRTFDSGPLAKSVGIVVAVAVLLGSGLLVMRMNHSRDEAAIAATKQTGIDAAAQTEDRRKGFHCLSRIDGSQPELVEAIKHNLRDPDSYQHIETQITPIDAKGQHHLMMHYRSRNGFGGMMDGVVTATVDSATCKVHVIASE